MRSLADNDTGRARPIKFSPVRGLLVVIGLAWLLATIWLLNYYWENSGWKADSSPNQLVDGHYQLDRLEAQSYGIGLNMRNPSNGTDAAIKELFALRQMQKGGSLSQQAEIVLRIRQDVQTTDNEAYRILWTPVLACAANGCDNEVYMRTAGALAARSPRWAGHAMIIETYYWSQARVAGDSAQSATAVARLDSLVHTYASPELKTRWAALENCGQSCPLFEELALDFMAEAVNN